jgi:hypothetical protein
VGRQEPFTGVGVAVAGGVPTAPSERSSSNWVRQGADALPSESNASVTFPELVEPGAQSPAATFTLLFKE